jgi:hypothetical protein
MDNLRSVPHPQRWLPVPDRSALPGVPPKRAPERLVPGGQPAGLLGPEVSMVPPPGAGDTKSIGVTS